MATKDYYRLTATKKQTKDCKTNAFGNLNMNEFGRKHHFDSFDSKKDKSFIVKKESSNKNFKNEDYGRDKLQLKLKSAFTKSNLLTSNAAPISKNLMHYELAKSNRSSSTLSLHIAAYEDSITDVGDHQFIGKKDKPLKKSFTCHHEFPRQQRDDKMVPAVMQFTASQQLLNPNQDGVWAGRTRGIRKPLPDFCFDKTNKKQPLTLARDKRNKKEAKKKCQEAIVEKKTQAKVGPASSGALSAQPANLNESIYREEMPAPSRRVPASRKRGREAAQGRSSRQQTAATTASIGKPRAPSKPHRKPKKP